MRAIVTILSILLTAPTLLAQDKLYVDLDKSLTLTTGLADSSEKKDSLKIIPRITEKLDSVVVSGDTIPNALNRKIQKIEDLSDTVTVFPGLALHKADSTLRDFSVRLQSATTMSSPLSKIDILAKSNEVLEKISDAKENVNGGTSDVLKNVNQPANTVNEKINLLKQESGGQAPALDGLNVHHIESPLSNNVGAEIPKVGESGSSIPQLDLPKGLSANTALPDIDVGIQELPEVSGPLEPYTDDLKSIAHGDLSQVQQLDKDLLENAAPDELNVLKENGAMADNLTKDLMTTQNNPEAFKKHLLEKSRQMVAEKLASSGDQLTQTAHQISKQYKRVGTIFEKVKGLPKRPEKEKKPSVLERFVPSISLQLQRNEHWLTDLTPAVHYRIKSFWSAGLGWNERIEFDSDLDFYSTNRVYGLRSFTEVCILKGVWVRGEVERMSISVPSLQAYPDKPFRKTEWNYLIGLKKQFTFAPGVGGNMQLMYNLYDPFGKSSYESRLNIRFGFDFSLVRNKKG